MLFVLTLKKLKPHQSFRYISSSWLKSENNKISCISENLSREDSYLRLKAQGIQRITKPYIPPQDIENIIKKSVNKVFGQHYNDVSWKTIKLENLELRFKFLHECMLSLPRCPIPNSVLHSLNNVEQVYLLFATPNDVRNPLEIIASRASTSHSALSSNQLQHSLIAMPQNLHIQTEYRRFADNVGYWNNITAFSGQNTQVTQLKYKQLYKPYQAEKSWPYEKE